MIQRCWGYTYEQGESRVRVGEERGGKEIDGCPLTVPPLFINNKKFTPTHIISYKPSP
jgi:hypothetical protein